MHKFSSRLIVRTSAISFGLLLPLMALAFTEPTTAPPGGDVPAPINVGSATQLKTGVLQIQNFANNLLNLNANQVWNSGGALYLQYSGPANSNVIVGGKSGVIQQLGLNTQTPGGTLDVENGAGTATICLNGTDAAHCTTSITGGGTNFWTGSLTGSISNANSGGVGIGTSTANAKLAVDGHGVIGSANNTFYDVGAGRIAANLSIYSYGSICTGNGMGDCSGANGTVVGTVNANATNNIPNSGVAFITSGSLGVGTKSPIASSLTVDNAAHTMQICLNGTDAAHCTTSITGGGTNFWTGSLTGDITNANSGNVKVAKALTVGTTIITGGNIYAYGTNGQVSGQDPAYPGAYGLIGMSTGIKPVPSAISEAVYGTNYAQLYANSSGAGLCFTGNNCGINDTFRVRHVLSTVSTTFQNQCAADISPLIQQGYTGPQYSTATNGDPVWTYSWFDSGTGYWDYVEFYAYQANVTITSGLFTSDVPNGDCSYITSNAGNGIQAVTD